MSSVTPDSGPTLAIDASFLGPDRTGLETYVLELLPRLQQRWAGRMVVFIPRSRLATDFPAGVEVVLGGGRGWTQLRLGSALRQAQADIFFNPIPILPLAARLPCPAVVTVHDLLEFRRRWWYVRRLLGRTFERAAAVVAVSGATEAELRGEFPWVAAKTTVVREGADTELFKPAVPPYPPQGRAPVLDRLAIDAPPLLAVGTIQPRKNYARLIMAYARLDPKAAPPLVIVGRPGWDHEEVMRLPGTLGIEDRVRFTGHLGEAAVADLMRASRMLLALSTGEGFGLPLVEAMHCGLPILASDIPPFREVAGNAARFVDPLDVGAITAVLEQLLPAEEELLEMSAAGLGRRSLFSWDRAAAELVDVLRRVLA